MIGGSNSRYSPSSSSNTPLYNNNNNNGNNNNNNNSNNAGGTQFNYYIMLSLKYDLDDQVSELEWIVIDVDKQFAIEKRNLFVYEDNSNHSHHGGINDTVSLANTLNVFNNYVFSSFIMNQKSFCIVSIRPNYMVSLINESLMKGIKLLRYFYNYINLCEDLGLYFGINGTLESFGKSLDMNTLDQELPLASQIVLRLLKQGHYFTPVDSFSTSNGVGAVPQGQYHIPPNTFSSSMGDYSQMFGSSASATTASAGGNMMGGMGMGMGMGAMFGPTSNSGGGTMSSIRSFGLGGNDFGSGDASGITGNTNLGMGSSGNNNGMMMGGVMGHMNMGMGGPNFNTYQQHQPSSYNYGNLGVYNNDNNNNNNNNNYQLSGNNNQYGNNNNNNNTNNNNDMSPTHTPNNINASVLLRGLPWGVSEDAIREFFLPLEITTIDIFYNSNGKQTGDASVEFATEEDATLSLDRHKQMMGTRYIEVISRRKHPPPPPPPSLSQLQSSGNSNTNGKVLKLRGLPFSISTMDIRKFLNGYPIKNNNILMATNDEGRFSGEAYVEFQTPEIAQAALTNLQNKTMMSRYIEFFPCERFIQFHSGDHHGNNNHHHHHSNQYGQQQYNNQRDNHHYNNMNHLQQHNNNNMMGDYFNQTNNYLPPYMDNHGGYHQNNNNSMGGGGHYHGGGGASSIKKSKPYGSKPYQPNHQSNTNKQQQSSGGGGGGSMGGQHKADTVKLRGLPFTTTENDIATFFNGLDIAPGGIKIVYQRDRPMGIAYVTFTNSDDYSQALSRNNQHMGPRYIEVFPSTSKSHIEKKRGGGVGGDQQNKDILTTPSSSSTTEDDSSGRGGSNPFY